ncbi:hypothetical protein GCM10009844_41930 [Nocardioides koreensis]|uniref:GerMN domain-containing protein n=1 Tax=Nocardioides koreensis TaxID=433651 RepID=A0ABN3A7I2_9ACTN
MTEPHTPGSRPDDDTRLAALLSDAVSDVEPREALDSIRNRTKVTPLSARRPWTYAVGGAVVATAAVIGAIAFAGDQLGLTGSDDTTPAASHRPRHTPTKAVTSPDQNATASSAPSASPVTTSSTLAGYYLGDTPQGPRLYREFDRVEATDPVDGALQLLVADPHDPDYSTPWKPGDLTDGVLKDGVVDVVVDSSLAQRPAGMTEQYAREAVQQVVYTVQAAVQSRVPVHFSLDTVLGVDTSEPVANAPVLDTLSHVSLTSPSEGQVVDNGKLAVEGVANSFEANVVVRVQRYEGTEIVAQEPFTAEAWMGDKLFPFSGTIDLSGVPAGRYLVMAMTDDPSGGTEGSGAFTDTRTITIP